MPLAIENFADMGRYLKDSRESLRLTLEDVARALNIRARYLAAIEEGNIAALPGSIYTKGYIQNYAAYLGLDKDQVIALFEKLRGKQKESFFYLAPARVEMIPEKLLLVLSFLMIVTIYLGWRTFMVVDKEFDFEVRDIPTPAAVEATTDTEPKASAEAPAPRGCLDPHWDKLYPPCQYYVQPKGNRLNLIPLYESPVFRK